ncbi:DEAD/DEAH box helicase [uncultured Halomonas sp.]|uniref:DEAD/DEAH box helicase n=1 Tax=uncultured Halomonas sp. TaxID=173971 RepID=UPI00262ABB90|nr:DEAD/DEAH box helicase [uncultured Halomonas sp.]
MDPGMGKTGSVLYALDALRMAGSNFFPALVIAPKRVARSVWSAEAERWEDFSAIGVSVVAGKTIQYREQALNADALLYSINYENIPWLVDYYKAPGRQWPFKTVIADESTRLKGFRLRRGTLRSAALAKVAKHTGRWMNLTGTPAPNGLLDLWGQQWFVDKGHRLGRTYSAFKERFFDENVFSGEITPKPHAEKRIMQLIDDVTLSLDAADYMDLPDMFSNVVPVRLPRPAMEMYKRFEQDLFAMLDDAELDANTAADASLKCLQIASGAFYTDDNNTEYAEVHSEKIDALRNLVGELNSEPVIVCYHFRHDRWRLMQAFPEARVLDTQQDEDDWNAGKIPMLLVHPASAGHGLNLQHGGRHMVFFTNWWALEDYMQVLERIGPTRQSQSGYDRPVFVHHLVAQGTVEEDVIERRETKKSVQQAVRERAGRKSRNVA